MLALTQGLMTLGAGGGAGAQTRWRVNVTATQTSDGFFVGIAELEMRSSAGGANVATGGLAQASSLFGSTPPANAFDGSAATQWVSAEGMGSPQWISYLFGSAVEIVEVAITSSDTVARALRAPVTFDIQSSPDGLAWTTVWTVTGSTGWGITETRVFTKP